VIMGIGIDLCSIPRIEKAIESEHFMRKVFSPEEIRYACGKARPARHFAGCFAAREAFAKASGIPMYSVVFGHGVWIERTASAPPQLRCSETIKEQLQNKGKERIHLSISHDGEYAVAVVILEVDS